ncbi:DUF418 domain-containing protein [Paenibacillus sp. HWE-109]|uniref:DUF418 domain-containing protein n=1 Tax=Paenibacillus sp. HWE-109 TaxID=1306526 RepID=UPI001EE09786|nr:DUF418 domain-containing protein [Paenibacillus sp. HWE-109]UKS24743.1 DUF418 domain-containing protein [Paenibacillus sp. HWE-109]
MAGQPNRLSIIDSMRGFSLLGILLANMLIFQYGIWGKDEMAVYSLSQVDSITKTLLHIFVEGSFMPIFTFLFGFGMINMQESLAAKGLKPKRYLGRRFLLLLAFGIAHGTYLWEGDILVFYGGMGLFLLLFMNRKAKTLLIVGALLLGLFGLLGLAPESTNHLSTMEDKIRMETYVKDTFTIYGTGTYEEIKHHRNTADPLGLNEYLIITMMLFAPLMTAPLFIFGMYAAKKQWFREPDNVRAVYLKRMLIFLPIGVLLKVAKTVFPDYGWSEMGEMIGSNLLSLGYIFAFALCYVSAKSSPWLLRFEAVGKLSLTNYLLQSVIGTTIFYGYGLGWFGKMGVVAGCGLALIIYLGQLFISRWYLTHFTFGPVERVLRMWTYLSFNGKANGVRYEK